MNDVMNESTGRNKARDWLLLNRLSIRGKLLGTVIIVYTISMSVAAILFLNFQWSVLKEQSLADLKVLASMTADNLTASLSFDDLRDAQTVLDTLKRQPAIVRAGVFRTDGSYFTSYWRDPASKGPVSRPKGRTYQFTKEGLAVFHDVVLDLEPIGYVYILNDMRQARALVIKSFFGLMAVSLIGLVLAVILSSTLQRTITRPLFHLAETASRVTNTGDFSIRADKYYEDEVGGLTDAFNRMLEQIGVGEIAIRESETRFRTIFQSNPDSISICRLSDGAWIDVNDQFTSVTGYERNDVLGKTGLDIGFWVIKEDRDHLFETLSRNGIVSGVETTLRRKDGSTFTSLMSAATIDLEGLLHMVSIMRDVTESKKAQKQIKKYQDSLEQLVKERTAQLEEAQEELVHRERLSVLGQLTATVSHEIRNPLGTVRNAVFSIGDAFRKGEEKRIERALKLAERNILRVDDIISELLYYTREREMQVENTEVDTWLRHVIFEQEIPEGIDLIVDLSADVSMPMDREKMRRAFLNIFQNALQAVQGKGEGQGTVTVSTRKGSEGFLVVVTDTGTGILKKDLEQIFEPLFSTKSFGVGLGMSIVKNIVEEHGGTVHVDSEPGKGTTVTLNVPV